MHTTNCSFVRAVPAISSACVYRRKGFSPPLPPPLSHAPTQAVFFERLKHTRGSPCLGRVDSALPHRIPLLQRSPQPVHFFLSFSFYPLSLSRHQEVSSFGEHAPQANKVEDVASATLLAFFDALEAFSRCRRALPHGRAFLRLRRQADPCATHEKEPPEFSHSYCYSGSVKVFPCDNGRLSQWTQVSAARERLLISTQHSDVFACYGTACSETPKYDQRRVESTRAENRSSDSCKRSGRASVEASFD